MENYTLYEVLAMITALIIGTGAYVAFVYQKRLAKVTFSFIISTLFINALFVWVLENVLRSFDMGKFRTWALPLVAFMGQYLIDWINTSYPKIFNAAARKAGLDLEDTEPTKIQDYGSEDNTEGNHTEDSNN